ncbi:MAG: HlyD family efflux transporter periplasmic adaptor subunit [Sedimenticola sp.]
MDDERLPRLRQELRLNAGPAGIGGAPTWTLHDPVNNRFFQIGFQVYEILSQWEYGTAQGVAEHVCETTGLHLTEQDVSHVAEFLCQHNLHLPQGEGGTAKLIETKKRRQVGYLQWLLKNYLFIRIPLFHPDAFLTLTYPWIAWLYRPWVRWLALSLGGLGLFLAGRQWDHFIHSLTDLFSLEGMFWFALALFFAKAIHELGHAYTAHRYGCRVASMGLAFLVMWPVLYTDVTDAWKLPSRRARIAISSAGMIAELGVAFLATLLWSFLPDGVGRSAVFLIATTTWIGTLAINLLPFLRFDGYYLLSDILRIDNLFERAFALGRWRLRESLFGWGEQVPEQLPSKLHRFLIGFAFAVWVYRLFLFLGIAVLVYYFFFKALGILLFAVEMWWFILRPVMGELMAWWKRGKEGKFNLRSAITMGLLLLLIGLFFTPWHSDIAVSSVMLPVNSAIVFTPRAARIQSVDTRHGQHVTEGERLMVLENPELEYKIRRTQRRRNLLQWEVANAGISGRLSVRRLVAEEELRTVIENLSGLLEELDQLEIRAPFSGWISEPMEFEKEGQWLAANMPIIQITGEGQPVIEGYLPEEALSRVPIGSSARFYPDIAEISPIDCRLVAVDGTSAKILEQRLLAKRHGGLIATRDAEKQTLAPTSPHYRILLDPLIATKNQQQQVLRGVVVVQGHAQSMARRVWRLIQSVVIRESGF